MQCGAVHRFNRSIVLSILTSFGNFSSLKSILKGFAKNRMQSADLEKGIRLKKKQ